MTTPKITIDSIEVTMFIEYIVPNELPLVTLNKISEVLINPYIVNELQNTIETVLNKYQCKLDSYGVDKLFQLNISMTKSSLYKLDIIKEDLELAIRDWYVNKTSVNVNNVGPEYYYRNNHCLANDVSDPKCRCWHKEGEGPFPNATPLIKETPNEFGYGPVTLTWRNLPKVKSE